MASVVIAIGVAAYFATKKIQKRKEKKRGLNALQHGPVEEVSIIDDATVHDQVEDLPTYYKQDLPQYHPEDLHPAFRDEKQNTSIPYSEYVKSV
jgi:hypothetical protein